MIRRKGKSEVPHKAQWPAQQGNKKTLQVFACSVRLSKKPRRVFSTQRKNKFNRFLRRRVRRGKHFSRSEVSNCTPLAYNRGMERSAIPFVEEDFVFFDKLTLQVFACSVFLRFARKSGRPAPVRSMPAPRTMLPGPGGPGQRAACQRRWPLSWTEPRRPGAQRRRSSPRWARRSPISVPRHRREKFSRCLKSMAAVARDSMADRSRLPVKAM